MAFEFNSQQREVITGGMKWFRKGTKQTLEISGAAGTGKTTIIRSLTENLGLKHDEVLYMAFVGKAAQNLALSGLNAKTVHSTIYRMEEVPRLDENGEKIIRNGRTVTRKAFVLKEHIPPNIKLLVVDEAGTISSDMAEDILSFGLPVIALGDLNQLKPIFGSAYFLKEPDYILTQIMRQAEDSEIVWFAHQILQGKDIPVGKYNNSRVINFSDLQDEEMKRASMMITIRNKTRDQINEYMRESVLYHTQGRNAGQPLIVGDKVVCRRNNWYEKVNWMENDLYLTNGMVGYVEDIHLDTYNSQSVEIDFRPDFMNESYNRLNIDVPFLKTPASVKYEDFPNGNQFQFGYAISTYMAQGSQYKNPMYFMENVPKNIKMSNDYAGVTRAEDYITIVKDDLNYY